MRVAVEVCVTTPQEATAATQAGADAVEVCTWLGAGGITPSNGMVARIAAETGLTVRALVRPATGSFHYDESTLIVLLTEIMAFHMVPRLGGIVTGVLSDENGLPLRLRVIGEACAKIPWTFHRAIDHAPDRPTILEQALAAGATRILTSGGEATALAGARGIAALVEQANGRCVIAAAAGIGPHNVVEVVERTGVPEVHFSAQRIVPAEGMPLGAEGNRTVLPDVAKIEGVMNALVKAGLR